jgi:DNA-binding winged helix-turn-helix (wHTH) protein
MVASVTEYEMISDLDGSGLIDRKTKKYTRAVDAEYSEHSWCPTCSQHWPGLPSVFVCVEDGFAVVDSKVVRMRKLELRLFSSLVENAGRYMQRDDLVADAYFDKPDADTPDARIISVVMTGLRKMLEGTRYCIASRPRYGYRFVLREVETEVAKKELEQARREKAAWKRIRAEQTAGKNLARASGALPAEARRLKRTVH